MTLDCGDISDPLRPIWTHALASFFSLLIFVILVSQEVQFHPSSSEMRMQLQDERRAAANTYTPSATPRAGTPTKGPSVFAFDDVIAPPPPPAPPSAHGGSPRVWGQSLPPRRGQELTAPLHSGPPPTQQSPSVNMPSTNMTSQLFPEVPGRSPVTRSPDPSHIQQSPTATSPTIPATNGSQHPTVPTLPGTQDAPGTLEPSTGSDDEYVEHEGVLGLQLRIPTFNDDHDMPLSAGLSRLGFPGISGRSGLASGLRNGGRLSSARPNSERLSRNEQIRRARRASSRKLPTSPPTEQHEQTNDPPPELPRQSSRRHAYYRHFPVSLTRDRSRRSASSRRLEGVRSPPATLPRPQTTPWGSGGRAQLTAARPSSERDILPEEDDASSFLSIAAGAPRPQTVGMGSVTQNDAEPSSPAGAQTDGMMMMSSLEVPGSLNLRMDDGEASDHDMDDDWKLRQRPRVPATPAGAAGPGMSRVMTVLVTQKDDDETVVLDDQVVLDHHGRRRVNRRVRHVSAYHVATYLARHSTRIDAENPTNVNFSVIPGVSAYALHDLQVQDDAAIIENVQFLEDLGDPKSLADARALKHELSHAKGKNAWRARLFKGQAGCIEKIFVFLARRWFLQWVWHLEYDSETQSTYVVAKVPRGSLISLVSMAFAVLQFYSMTRPCADNGWSWDEQCWTGFAEGGSISTVFISAYSIYKFPLWNRADDTWRVWPDMHEGGILGNIAKTIYLLATCGHGLLMMPVLMTTVWPYVWLPTVPIAAFACASAISYLIIQKKLCCKCCHKQKIPESIIYYLGFIALFALLYSTVWAIFAGGKYNSGVSYMDSLLCPFEERSMNAYTAEGFGSFRAWINSL